MQYLALGFSLDDFIKSFGENDANNQKLYFSYEFMADYSKLEKVTQLPGYEAFYSSLKQENVLNAEYVRFCLRHHVTESEVLALENRPKTGREKYDELDQLWKDMGWTNFGEYREYHNLQDFVHFLSSIERYPTSIQSEGVDMMRDGISLPVLAKQMLRSYVGYTSLYHIDSSFVYHTIHKSEVGGQSIIFTRQNDEQHPYIKGFDANCLYLYCLGEGQFTGRCIVYRPYAVDYLRVETVKYNIRRHPYQKDSIEVEECFSYIDNEFIEANNLVLERQVRIRLSQSELRYLSAEYKRNNIDTSSIYQSFIVDGVIVINSYYRPNPS